jgi:hypothetical protein
MVVLTSFLVKSRAGLSPAGAGGLTAPMPRGAGLVVHPASDLTYASYVLHGLAARLGHDAITYATGGFPPSYGGGRVLACYRAEDPGKRAFLVFTDQTTVNTSGKEWAAAYGAVNLAPDDANSTLALGPTFGIRLTSRSLVRRHLAGTWRWALEGLRTLPRRKVRIRIAADRTRALAKHQRARAPITAYRPHPSDADYVFFTAWPWAKHGDVNPPRIRFIDACRRAPGLQFEGGFAPRRRRDVPEVLPYTTEARYPLLEYLAKLGRSAVAFNNPAVHGCLGWKLGEYLAMGKAIITLPIDRVLPSPLEHGVHVHVIDGSPASLDDALARLRADDDYRGALERNARAWYEDYLAPECVADRVLRALDL